MSCALTWLYGLLLEYNHWRCIYYRVVISSRAVIRSSGSKDVWRNNGNDTNDATSNDIGSTRTADAPPIYTNNTTSIYIHLYIYTYILMSNYFWLESAYNIPALLGSLVQYICIYHMQLQWWWLTPWKPWLLVSCVLSGKTLGPLIPRANICWG